MIDTIFLDLDGTLTDITERHFDVYRTCVSEFNGLLLTQAEYWDMKRSNVDWSDILRNSGIKVEAKKDFLGRFISLIETPDELDKDVLFADAARVLDDLSSRYTIVLVSLRRDREGLLKQLDRLGITKYFKAVLSGHSETVEGTLLKKAEVIREWGSFKKAVIIGDTEADIAAAKQLNLLSIAVTTGIRSNIFLQGLKSDYVVDSLTEAVPRIN